MINSGMAYSFMNKLRGMHIVDSKPDHKRTCYYSEHLPDTVRVVASNVSLQLHMASYLPTTWTEPTPLQPSRSYGQSTAP